MIPSLIGGIKKNAKNKMGKKNWSVGSVKTPTGLMDSSREIKL